MPMELDRPIRKTHVDMEVDQKEMTGPRLCTGCRAEIPPSAFGWAKLCFDCYAEKKNRDAMTEMRECTECREMSVPKAAEPWRKICSRCYVTTTRDCSQCPKKLKPGAPKYQTLCHTCWTDKRKLTHAVCTACPEERKTHLRRLKSKPFCDECMETLSIFKRSITTVKPEI